MSDDLSASLRGIADPKLSELFSSLPATFVAGVEEHLEGVMSGKIEKALTDAADFRYKALTAPDQDTARDYAEAVETALRRAKTLVWAERVVASEAIGNAIIDGFKQVLDAAAYVGKGLLTALTAGLVKGAIAGLTGGGEGDGGAFDPASLFRGT